MIRRRIQILAVLPVLVSCGPADDRPIRAEPAAERQLGLSGPYLGQRPPGREPQIFAPGLVSTGMAERDLAMTPDGNEIYFTSVLGAGFELSAIVVTRRVEGVWTRPEVAPFSGRYRDLEPAISPDGARFFFVSHRPTEGEPMASTAEDIWMMKRRGQEWGEPTKLGTAVNTDQAEFFPSITREGTLYFTRRSEDRSEAIFRSRWVDGGFQKAERLGPEVNAAPTQFNAFIDPDEGFLIVCSWGRDDSLGGVDYYIVFRDPNDRWSGPYNLGPAINTAEGREWSPYVSPDGRYFFFMSSRSSIGERAARQALTYADLERLHREPMNGNSDIWWVDADVLEDLRPVDPPSE